MDCCIVAEIAQLVEHNLAKVGVASSSLVFRSKEGDPKVKDRLKGYLSFFKRPGPARRVRVMDFFLGGVEDNTDN